MATVSGLTKERMLQIEGASIINARLNAGTGDLILTRQNGTDINVGKVSGFDFASLATIMADPDAAARLEVEKSFGDNNRKTPLTGIVEKTKTGKFRIGIVGTSIASFDNAPVRLLAEDLQNVYGEGKTLAGSFGAWGGSYEANPVGGVTGWVKQKYGGWGGTRLRGASGSAQLNPGGMNFYGDKLVISVSVEADSAPAKIIVDGVVMANTPSAGTQKYKNVIGINLTLGSHSVVFEAPDSATPGYVYYEYYEVQTSTAKGVEIIDMTMGGMGLRHMSELWAPGTGQVAGIPIINNNGLDFHFKRPDIDLLILEHTTNDGDLATFKTNVNYAVEQFRLMGKPVLVVTEPSQSPGSEWLARYRFLLSLRKNSHVTVIDWHNALYTTPQTLMHSLYYTGSDTVHPDTPGYQVLSMMLSHALDLRPFPSTSRLTLEKARQKGRFVAELPGRKIDTFDGPGVWPNGVTLPAPSGLAMIAKTQPFLEAYATNLERYYYYPLRLNPWRGQQKAIQVSPTGTDEFGKYQTYNNGAIYTEGPTTDLETWIATFKIAPRVAGQNISIGFSGGAWQIMELDGKLIQPNTPAPSRTNQLIYTPEANSVEPVVIAIPFRRISTTSPSNGNVQVTGKVYDLTLSRTPVPILDTSKTTQGVDYVYGPINAAPETVEIYNGSALRMYRYAVEDFAVYEFRNLKTGTDIYTFNGELVPGYRDSRAQNYNTSINAAIAASTKASRGFGKYETFSDTDLLPGNWGMAVGSVRRVTFRAHGGTVNFKVSGDFRISINGRDAIPEVTGTQQPRFFSLTTTDAPAYFSFEVLQRTNTGGSITIGGDIYELSVTNSSSPILTHATGVL